MGQDLLWPGSSWGCRRAVRSCGRTGRIHQGSTGAAASSPSPVSRLSAVSDGSDHRLGPSGRAASPSIFGRLTLVAVRYMSRCRRPPLPYLVSPCDSTTSASHRCDPSRLSGLHSPELRSTFDPGCRKRLHLRLRDARRDRGVGHRLGPDPRVRGIAGRDRGRLGRQPECLPRNHLRDSPTGLVDDLSA